MPLHTAASVLQYIDQTVLTLTVAGLAGGGFVKAKMGGRRCTWERDWAGKMILISAPPTPTTLSLIDYLLNLPHPPQILYLPPFPSPLPPQLLTILHAMRLTTTNPLAQLHCEALPRTPLGVRSFCERWGKTTTGMTGEGGRRIDAIILGGGWAVDEPDFYTPYTPDDIKAEKRWTVHEQNFHLLHSLLPALLRQPAERNIRIISLCSPTISTALPTLQGKPAKNDPAQVAGAKGITTLLFNQHFQLVLDTLAAVALKKVKEVPNVDGEKVMKKKEEGVGSNILAIGVVMPWTRDEVVRGLVGVEGSWWRWLLWILFYPLLIVFTPSPRRAIQSVIYALQAPVRYGPLDTTSAAPAPLGDSKSDDAQDKGDPRRNGVGGADVVRDCAVVDMPPVLSDKKLAKITYDSLEKSVETGVKADAKREKTFPTKAAPKEEPDEVDEDAEAETS